MRGIVSRPHDGRADRDKPPPQKKVFGFCQDVGAAGVFAAAPNCSIMITPTLRSLRAAAGAALLLTAGTLVSSAQINLGFETASLGPLDGQQGWTVGEAYESTVPYVVNPSAPAPTGVGTKVLYGDDSASAPYGATLFYHAITPGSFSYSSTSVTLQFDFQRTSADLVGNGLRVALGHDADNDGQLGFNESLSARMQDDAFYRDASDGTSTGVARTTLGAGNYDDWYTLRLVADLSTGIGELSFRNLTAGELTFSSVSTGSLKLGFLSVNAGPSTWDRVEIVLPYAAFVDNVQISGGSAVPEPSTYAAVAGLAVLGLAGCRRRRAVSVAPRPAA